jgi:hypothetical protein
MTYPQQPAPQYPQQGYPAQQPGYPVAPQGYPQQPMAPQGYPQTPAPQLAEGSLDAFYSQPSVGGGAALKFQIGTTHVFMVSRPVTGADVQQQTQRGTGLPATFRDGRPKFVMKVPARVALSAEHADGTAQWYCQGAARDLLAQAMAAVGAPEGPPQAGSVVVVTKTGERPVPNMNPAGVYTVQYVPPGPQADGYAQQCGISLEGIVREGAAPAAAPVAPPAPPAAPAPAPVAYQPPAPPAPPAPPVAYQPPPPAPVAYQPPPPAPVAYPPPAPQPQAPAAAPALPPPPPAPVAMPELANDPDKAALLARLTNQAPAPVAG